MVAGAARKLEELFDVLRVDYANDPHTRETPQRVARMFVEELLLGHYTAPPKSRNSRIQRVTTSSS